MKDRAALTRRLAAKGRSVIDPLLSNRSAKNVIWNLVGGLWAGVLTILATPWYVARLGLEGYGLVGLWLMMQVMLGLLDLGMGATLVKEFANSPKDGNGQSRRSDLLKTLEYIYWSLALCLTLVLVLAADWVADSWLRSESLSKAYLGHAIRLMSVALGVQFPCTLYSNGLAGLQDQGRMNALQMLGNGLRYGSGAAVLLWRADVVWFFSAQALVAAIQTFATRRAVWQLISEGRGPRPVFRVEVLRRLWRFSIGMALTASSGVLLANVDRIFLSRMATTEELGKYAVAFTATGLLQMGIQPFYRALFPRYAELVASGDTIRLRNEYFRSCRWMATIIIPLGAMGWVFAPQIFHAWIGKQDGTIVEVFRWLLVGITGAGLMWLPAALQQAHGWTRLHAGMIVGALVLGASAMVWTIKAFGTVGATVVWVVHGASDITLGLWLMHRRLLVGELLKWYRTVVLPPLVWSIPLVGVPRWLMPHGLTRWGSLGWIAVTGMVVVAASLTLALGQDRKGRASHER